MVISDWLMVISDWLMVNGDTASVLPLSPHAVQVGTDQTVFPVP